MLDSKLRVSILVKGRAIDEYRISDGRTFVEGRDGSDYEIEIENLSSKRRLVVVSVDGLGVMTGKEASMNDKGYLVSSREVLRIPGWRLDSGSVAQFVFGDKKHSYAASTGNAANVGVIGVAAFNEKEVYVPPPPRPRRRYDDDYWPKPLPWDQDRPWKSPPYKPYWMNEPVERYGGGGGGGISSHIGGSGGTIRAAGASGNMKSKRMKMAKQSSISDYAEECAQLSDTFNMGTEFGEVQTFKTTSVEFEKASSTPILTMELFYTDRRGLQKLGVVFSGRKYVDRPSAFPKDDFGCTPPPKWLR